MPSKARQIFHLILGYSFLISCIYLAYVIFEDLVVVENEVFEYHEPTNEDFPSRTYPLPDLLEVPEQETTEQ